MFDYPNIFTAQSKEFSQDGFIDWLLRCADPFNRDRDTRRVGQEFIHFLIAKHNSLVAELEASGANRHALERVDPDLPINEVLSVRQHLRIDVLGRINGGGGLYIIFENKQGTEIHDDQVTRYREDLRKDLTTKYGEGKGQMIGVYYKVLEERDYDAVRDTYHYCTLSRQEMMQFLAGHDTANPILQMYHAYLTELDTRIHDWKRMTIEEMHDEKHAGWALWSGWFSELYQELKARLTEDAESRPGWGWVNNAGGGFHALWVGNWEKDKPTVYIQCDEHTLKVRMSGDRSSETMQKAWDSVCAQLASASPENRAKRMQHNAQSAEIGNLGSYIQPDPSGNPSIPLTADHLLRVFVAVKVATNEARASGVGTR